MKSVISLYLNLLNKVPVLALLFLSAASVISGDYFGKAWSVNHKPSFLFFSFVGYFFSAFFYTPALLREGLVYTGIVWNVIGIIGFLVIGWVIFRESISISQTIGVILGISSLVILIFYE